MTTLEVISIILGSNIALEIVKQLFAKKYNDAGSSKITLEASNIRIDGELKITEFYKEQLETILTKYTALEHKLEAKETEAESYKQRLYDCEVKYQELQREFTLLKAQVAIDKLQ